LADPSADQNLAAAIGEVTERVSVLVREEIELAKLEVAAKVKTLRNGAIVGAAAGIFLLFALLFAMQGFAWLLWYILPTGSSPNFFWGFFAFAFILILLGAFAGYMAFRFLKRSTPPVPTMAIEEARKIREAVGSGPQGGN
jgi:uncharacterized membrane protein YgcG